MANEFTKDEMKQEAINRLSKLGIYKPYINGFVKKDQVCFFERFAGFWAYQDEELQNKIKEVEEHFGCVVYAVTHEYTNFGECYDMLVVSKYKEDKDNDFRVINSTEFNAFAYVWNKTDDWCSEFGVIGVKSFGGGIVRTA